MTDSDNLDKGQNVCFPPEILEMRQWRALTDQEREELYERSVCRTYHPGEMIFHQGDECRGVHLVREGLIGVRMESPEGDTVTLHLARPGDALGYRPFLAGEAHKAGAEVLKESTVCFFASSQMKAILLKNPCFGFEFLRRGARDLGEVEQKLHQTVTQNVRIRLIHLLLVLEKHYGRKLSDGTVEMDLPISRQDMASMIGIRVESLSRTIRHLTCDGLVRFSGRRAWLNDIKRMVEEITP
jgi:CRP/FNR family transcriptional regulator